MNEEEIEREKTESFELGHISQLKDMARDLRKRAGNIYANTSKRTELAKAKQLKELAIEYENEAMKLRNEWEKKWKGDTKE